MKKIKVILSYITILCLLVPAISGIVIADKSLYLVSDHHADPTSINAYNIPSAGHPLTFQSTYFVNSLGIGASGLAMYNDPNGDGQFDDALIYVTYEHSGGIEVFRAKDLAYVNTISTGALDLAGIVVDQAKERIYTVDRYTTNLYVYDANNFAPIGTLPIMLNTSNAIGLAIDEDNDFLFVTDVTSNVHYYDTATWILAGTVPTLSTSAIGVAFDNVSNILYTGGAFGGDLLLASYDINTAIASSIDMEIATGIPGCGAMGLAVDIETGLLYVTTGYMGDDLRVYDSNLNEVYVYPDTEGLILNPTGIVVPGVEAGYEQPCFPEETNGTSTYGPNSFGTTVTMNSGGGNQPYVKCKWESTVPIFNVTANFWEDDDMLAKGTQVDPICSGDKTVYYWAVVTDPDGVADVNNVYAEIFHPDGTFKYQIELENQLNKADSLTVFEEVHANNPTIMCYNQIPYYDQWGNQIWMNYTEIWNEIHQDHALIWWGEADLSYCQPAGLYLVDIWATDALDWSEILSNYFWYVPTTCVDYDFSLVNYGTVNTGIHKWIGGDQNMDTPHLPTVRNIGNVPIFFDIWQDDMGIGQTGENYDVTFDARLGAMGPIVTYDPFVNVTIPGHLELCTIEKLDFSITVWKGQPGNTFNGSMELWAHQFGTPFDPYDTPSQFT